MSAEAAHSGFMPIEDMHFFRDLEVLCDEVWACVRKWPPFARDTVGQQLVRSLDSVGSNTVEGDGRYSDRESIRFVNIANGSGREARFWMRRAKVRGLLTVDKADGFICPLESVLRRLSSVVAARRRRMAAGVREWAVEYGLCTDDR